MSWFTDNQRDLHAGKPLSLDQLVLDPKVRDDFEKTAGLGAYEILLSHLHRPGFPFQNGPPGSATS